jgi:DNA polymerase III alpha subunit
MRIRTGFSFRTAVGHLDDVISRIKEIGWNVAPISDRCSTFGFVEWTELAKNASLRPVYGVELAVVPELGQGRPIADMWTFFAKNNLRDLNELVALATSNPGKEPSLLYKQALSAKGLIKIAGERVLLGEIKKQPKDFFIGMSPSLPKVTYKRAKKLKMNFIATGDNYYPRENDKEFYRVALGWRSTTQTYPLHILSDDEWNEACWQFEEKDKKTAKMNRDWSFSKCKAELKKATLLVPEKAKTLRQMCEEAAPSLGVNLNNPVYSERLNRELALIDEKKFEDYFYIIADMIAYAKKRMIVGPARGSSCGSLVCFLLGITSIDPIPFDLIFERFIDTTRVDLPDIDIDFSDERRSLVFDYVEKKYGKDRVARLGTVMSFQPRSAMKQAGTVLKIPVWRVEKVLDGLVERSSGDSRALQALEDTLKDTEAGREMLKEFPEVLIAQGMEGHPSTAGQHAAGVVITNEPVMDYVAIDKRTNATMCSKYDAEKLNLLKIDALGLTQLSIFERTLELIGQKPVNGFLEQLPLDDIKAFDVLNSGNFSGVFQFTGLALQSLTKQIKVEHIEDMISITALARPGPMASGGANEWVKRRIGISNVSYPHDLFRPYLEKTLGIVVYQEQVMEIGRNIGDLTWDDVTLLRKAMSKSLGKEYFDQFGNRWKSGAIKKGIPESILTRVWDDLCAYGSWAFNRSHSVAYGLVSYWSCWLKAHYPIEFAAATLDAEGDAQKQISLLRELASEGIEYVSVDPDHSTDKWTPVKKDNRSILVGPLTSIKGIGPVKVAEIIDARKNGTELKPGVAKALANAKTDIDSLSPIADTIKRLHPNLQEINIHSTATPIKEVQCGVKGKVLIMAIAKSIAPRDDNDAQKIAQRNGRKVWGHNGTMALNMFLRDDTDEIFCKVHRDQFETIGRPIIEKGRAGKALYAIKGYVPDSFRMIWVERVKFLGFMDDE